MGEFGMHKRVEVFVTAAVAALAGAAQPTAAQPDPPAAATEPSVSVPREVLERYVGRYELNGAILTVGVTDDGRLTAQLSGQPPGPPLRTLSAREFVADAVGVRLSFDGEGSKASRVRSQYAGTAVVGTRIADGAASTPPAQPGLAASSLHAAARRDAVSSLGSALRQRYVVPDVGEQAAARIDAALAAGEYDGLADPAAFAARLSADVGAVAHDKHLRVNAMSGPLPPPPQGAMAMPRAESGVVRADRLAGGIGYIEVVAFPRRAAFAPAVDRAMASLSDSSALIIDMRRNLGGFPEGVDYLISFLLPPGQAIHINDIVTRVAGTNEFTREAHFSQPTPVSFADRPVYVLTSSQTFSGGEAFAYDVKALGRGVVVGERTAGGGNLTSPAQLGNGLIAMIPGARAENAITKAGWEGRGVEPDMAVPAADALGVALQRLGQPAVADIAVASREQVFAPRTAPLPGSEAALRALVAGVIQQPADLSAMSMPQAEMLRPQLPQVQETFRPLGAIRSIRFIGPGMPAGDAFAVTFANGALGMTVMLGPDGLIVGWQISPSPLGD